jgi:hypothetical protein
MTVKSAEELRRETKRYIGDGVYVCFDGFNHWLTTEDGVRVTNEICLELEILNSLMKYLEQWRRRDMNREKLLEWLQEQLTNARDEQEHCRSAGVNSPAFNQNMGEADAYANIIRADQNSAT